MRSCVNASLNGSDDRINRQVGALRSGPSSLLTWRQAFAPQMVRHIKLIATDIDKCYLG
jgi:hypothetical protein